MVRVESALDLIGNTPHVRLARLFKERPNVAIYSKLEKANPAGSIKDRIGKAMAEDAEKRGILKPGMVWVEPTSGNTGIGLAMVAAVKGYECILVMPESMSIERRKIMAAFGAKLELTPKEKGMKGAIAKAEEILAGLGDNGWMPMQFRNAANVQVHYDTTAEEILADFPEGLDYLITGVGTGGHITGVAKKLRERFPELQVFAVEPAKSPVLSGGQPGPHRIQGIGAGFIPEIMQVDVLTGVITVTEEDAIAFAQRSAREEGIFIGISSGASLAAVNQKLAEIPDGARVLVFNYDGGDRYTSIDDFIAGPTPVAASS